MKSTLWLSDPVWGGWAKMVITIIAMLMIMAAYFLLLYGGVGFIQDKRFFSSAPKENLAVIPDKKRDFAELILLAGLSLELHFCCL